MATAEQLRVVLVICQGCQAHFNDLDALDCHACPGVDVHRRRCGRQRKAAA